MWYIETEWLLKPDDVHVWNTFWVLTKNIRFKKYSNVFTERCISVAGNFEANSCQLSTRNMGMISENINIFDINVKYFPFLSVCPTQYSWQRLITKPRNPSVLFRLIDWLNPVQELFTRSGLSSCKNCSLLWHETELLAINHCTDILDRQNGLCVLATQNTPTH